jgi:hypothetical protein
MLANREGRDEDACDDHGDEGKKSLRGSHPPRL